MTENIVLSEVTKKDINDLVRLGSYSASLGGAVTTVVSEKDVEFFLAAINSSENNHIVVAKDSGRVIGVIVYTIGGLYYNTDTKVCNKLTWIVDPEYQQKGIGKILLDHMEEHARREGCAGCWISMRMDTKKQSYLNDYEPFEIYYKKEFN